MDRLACVDLHALPLQLLLREHPEWASAPAVVVDEDKPQGTILWVNQKARARRILRGMRYSAGLSLDGTLRAATVTDAVMMRAQKQILRALRQYTPHIDAAETGIFVLNASGLGRLFPALEYWARSIVAALHGQGLSARVVVGFDRFHVYALARARLREAVVVFDNREAEAHASQQVPLERLLDDREAIDALAKLGIATVGELLALPEGGLHERFGPTLSRLWKLGNGARKEPVRDTPDVEPIARAIALDDAETDSERLLFLSKRLLHPLLAQLAERGEALARLDIFLQLERAAHAREGERCETHVAPADPTLDAAVILDLVRLRFGALVSQLAAGVKSLRLQAKAAPAPREQLALFRAAPKRDLRAAERALARIRSEFGEQAVLIAKLGDGHLPEARYAWAPLMRLSAPAPRRVALAPLVRRFQSPGIALPQRARREPDGWLVSGLALGAVIKLVGPYAVSGGWQHREIQREYYFAQVTRGDWLWIYFDEQRRSWRQVGRIE
jgi:protein ImuB